MHDSTFVGPSFLGIGAPRCGTSWLYRALLSHPAVWLPPIKELHYFDSIDPTINEHFKVQERSYRLRRYALRRLRHYFAAPLAHFDKQAKSRIRLEPEWDLNYFPGRGDLKWYCRLFEKPSLAGLLTGDITPAYIMLSEQTISMIHAELSTRKLIVMLRNPVDAAWSAISKDVRDGELAVDLENREDVLHALARVELQHRYAYGDNLARWLKFYDRSELFIGYFEELEHSPVALLERVYSFLNLDFAINIPSARVAQKVNSASRTLGTLPRDVRSYLSHYFVPQLSKLAALLPDQENPWRWLEQAKNS
jgi:hypothetical protein